MVVSLTGVENQGSAVQTRCQSLSHNVVHFATLFVICTYDIGWVRIILFNATFNNISAISLRLALLMEQTGILGELMTLVDYLYIDQKYNFFFLLKCKVPRECKLFLKLRLISVTFR